MAYLKLSLLVAFICISAGCTMNKTAPEKIGSSPAPIPTPTETPPAAEIISCGEIEARSVVGKAAAPRTETGYVNVMDALEQPRFKPGCPNITAQLGTRFGIEVRVASRDGLSILPLRTRVTHPMIQNLETGAKTTVDQWESPMNAGIPRYAGWSFDNKWELVPGQWRIEIIDRDKVIAAQDFSVVVKP